MKNERRRRCLNLKTLQNGSKPQASKKPPTPATSASSTKSHTKRSQILPPTGKVNSIDQKNVVKRNTTPATIPKRSSASIRGQGFEPRAATSGKERSTSKPTVSMVLSNNSESYNMWLQRHLEKERQKKLEEKEKQKEEEERKKEQMENAERAFRQWQEENQRRFLSQKQRREREERESADKKEQEKLERRRNAEKTFETWKKRQEEKLREERIRRRQEERHRVHSAQEEKRRQKAENQKVYQKWVEQSLQRQREIRQMNLERELALRKQEDEEKAFKEGLASEAYHLWLEMKKKEKAFSESLAYKILDFEHESKKRWPTPWIPTGNTVPRRFVGTGNRRRTLEKPLSIVQQRAKSVY
ncbi:unnamed protein product [Bursaphelenchus okinawaensis]|uniref:Coiled-coil domain-containing protein 34 n=1 Tax=Bursaphelenchus okinawaensis TaxID=465554 RepID=A0A811KVL2_9BILA|nr:unnamed protein product [Bursaphelenchus okinawaensis]CAG9112968.1 unnamed protein product [Bursaphelenchus okinawaensis]